MSHPGSFPGDPAGPQPGGQRYPAPGPYGYPPTGYGGQPPPPYSVPPPGHSPPPQLPPGAFGPPPPHYGFGTGYPGPHGHPHPPAYDAQPATNGTAMGSLMSSLVAVPAYFLRLPFIGSVTGVAFGIVALNQIGKRRQKGREMAISGIVIGGVALLGSLILVMVYSSKSFLY
ncbi:MAG: DUF4190 domain-containing protein [Mycobacterium sp.]